MNTDTKGEHAHETRPIEIRADYAELLDRLCSAAGITASDYVEDIVGDWLELSLNYADCTGLEGVAGDILCAYSRSLDSQAEHRMREILRTWKAKQEGGSAS